MHIFTNTIGFQNAFCESDAYDIPRCFWSCWFPSFLPFGRGNFAKNKAFVFRWTARFPSGALRVPSSVDFFFFFFLRGPNACDHFYCCCLLQRDVDQLAIMRTYHHRPPRLYLLALGTFPPYFLNTFFHDTH